MATTTNARIVLTAEDRASRVIGQVQKQMAQAGETAKGFAGAAGLINPAFGAVAGAAGLVAFVKHAIDARDALNDVADATGASIEGLSGLERVAKLNGGTLDQVSSILVKFNQALNQASDPNSDAARTFAALGLSVKDLKEQDPSTALQKTAIALAGFADNGDKARGIMELFGKSTREAAPFLKDLAEAGQLNATVTEEQAAAAEKYNKQLFAMKVAAEDAGRALSKEVGSVLGELVRRYQTASAVFGGFAGVLGAGISQKLNFDDPVKGLTEYNRLLAEVDDKIYKATNSPDRGLANIRLEALQKERKELEKVAAYYRTLAGLDTKPGEAVDPGKTKPKLKIPGKSELPTAREFGEAEKALKSYVEQLEKEATKVEDLTGEQEALLKLQSLGTLGQNEQVRELVLGLAKRIQLTKDQAEIEKGVTAALEAQAQARRALDDSLDKFSGSTADALKQAQTFRLEARLSAGEIFSPEELDRIVKGIAGLETQTKETTDTMDKMLEQFARNAQDALGDTLEATLRGNFDSIGQLWGNMIIKMIAQAGAAQLGQTLLGDFAKSGNIGGIFGSVLGAIGFGAPKANGGSVSAMSLQRVNERGFEVFTTGGQDWLMTGGRGGTVTPNSQVNLGAPAPAPVVNVHNNISAGVTRGEVNAAVQWGMQKALQTMRAELRGQRVLA